MLLTFLQHYIANEQEANRNPETVDGVDIASASSNIDDRTMHELYLWPFQDAVRAGTASIMCSYQRINNSYGCQNSKTLNGLLKTELGFQGTEGIWYRERIQSLLTICRVRDDRLGGSAWRHSISKCWIGHGHAVHGALGV